MVVSLDQVKHGVADIQSILESLHIPVDVIESGCRLRWNTAVVLRIPEQQIPEVMLALRMQGFTDVMAYQSGEACEGVGGAEEGRQCDQMTSQSAGRNEGC